MSQPVRILCVIGVLAAMMGAVRSEDAPTTQQLKALEQTVQEQSKRIDTLTQQIWKLTQAIEGREVKNSGGPAPAAEEPPKSSVEPTPETSKTETTPPKAEAVTKADSANKHTVAKGETLTSIAKHYNITVAELQKTNKIENDRKLQIGQILSIPTPKTPEPSTEKKDNP